MLVTSEDFFILCLCQTQRSGVLVSQGAHRRPSLLTCLAVAQMVLADGAVHSSRYALATAIYRPDVTTKQPVEA